MVDIPGVADSVELVLLILVLVTSIIGLVTSLIVAKTARHKAHLAQQSAVDTAERVEEVHKIVNSQHDKLLAWAKTMEARLYAAGVDAPDPPRDVDMRDRRGTN